MKGSILVVAAIIAVQMSAAYAKNEAKPFQASAELGVLNGKAKMNESINGKNTLNLNANIKNAPIAKFGFKWEFVENAHLNFSAMHNLAKKRSDLKMDIRDPVNDQFIMQLNRTSSQLKRAYNWDLNVDYQFLNEPDYQVGAMLGVQQSLYNWKAKGGVLRLNNQVLGISPNSSIFEMEQKYTNLYLGVFGRYQVEQFELSSSVKYSPWVKGSNEVKNLNTGAKVDKTSANNAKQYAFMLNAAYEVMPDLKVFAEYDWEKFSKANKSGKTRVNGNRADLHQSFENQNSTLSVGVKYSF